MPAGGPTQHGATAARRACPPPSSWVAAARLIVEEGMEYGAAKLARKGCEMLVVNEVGENLTFGTDENTVTILFADGTEPVHASGSKDQVAVSVIDTVAGALGAGSRDR